MHVKQPVAITLHDHINQQQGSHHIDFKPQPCTTVSLLIYPQANAAKSPVAEQQDHLTYKSGSNQDWKRYHSHHNLETNYIAI